MIERKELGQKISVQVPSGGLSGIISGVCNTQHPDWMEGKNLFRFHAILSMPISTNSVFCFMVCSGGKHLFFN